MSLGSEKVFQRLKKFLLDNNVQFKLIDHKPTCTSKESSDARGEDLSIDGKAILLKLSFKEASSFSDKLALFVLSGENLISFKKIKSELNLKKVRLSSKEELYDASELVPGSVPPFGEPILPFDLYVDIGFSLKSSKIAFNAGLLTKSIILNMKDYLETVKPITFDFSEASSS